MVGVEMRADQPGRAAFGKRAGQQRLPPGAGAGVVDAGVEHRPAGAVLDQVDVDVVELERQREPQPQDAGRDLDRPAEFRRHGRGELQRGGGEGGHAAGLRAAVAADKGRSGGAPGVPPLLVPVGAGHCDLECHFPRAAARQSRRRHRSSASALRGACQPAARPGAVQADLAPVQPQPPDGDAEHAGVGVSSPASAPAPRRARPAGARCRGSRRRSSAHRRPRPASAEAARPATHVRPGSAVRRWPSALARASSRRRARLRRGPSSTSGAQPRACPDLPGKIRMQLHDRRRRWRTRARLPVSR